MSPKATKKKVYVGLTLDVFHPGIFNVLKVAASLGSVTVGLLTDRAVQGHKTPPAFSWEQREQMVRSLNGVDTVVPQHEWSYAPNILRLKPDYFIHGNDWTNTAESEVRNQVISALNSYGGILHEIEFTRGVSLEALEVQRRMNLLVPELRTAILRRSLDEIGFVRVIEAHSPLAALAVEKALYSAEGTRRTFHAIWSSSLADSAFLGLPDNEVVDFSRRLKAIEPVLRVSALPLIFDGDTGGLPEHFGHRVRELEHLGVAAVIIEDKRGQKRNSLIADHSEHELEDKTEFAEKIRYGVTSRSNPDFMIIARLESLIAGGSLSDCLERADIFIGAGADGIMIHSKQENATEVITFANEFRKRYADVPLVAVPTTYSSTSESVLRDAGFNVVIYANHMIRASYAAMSHVAEVILQNERSFEAENQIAPVNLLIALGNMLR